MMQDKRTDVVRIPPDPDRGLPGAEIRILARCHDGEPELGSLLPVITRHPPVESFAFDGGNVELDIDAAGQLVGLYIRGDVSGPGRVTEFLELLRDDADSLLGPYFATLLHYRLRWRDLSRSRDPTEIVLPDGSWHDVHRPALIQAESISLQQLVM